MLWNGRGDVKLVPRAGGKGVPLHASGDCGARSSTGFIGC
jgi:hypothetical protein